MNIHKNSRLKPQGRALLVRRVGNGRWRAGDAAAAAGLSQRRAFRWLSAQRLSQAVRKWTEEANGWIKKVGGMAQTELRGVARVERMFVLKAAAYNLIRFPRLLATG